MPPTLRWTLLAAVLVALVQLPASASGSIGAGGGKAGGRGDYTRGKAIVHRELVCNGCPISRRDFDAAKARALSNDIATAMSGSAPNDMVRSLCRAGDRAECVAKLRAVQTYIKRRFRL